MDGQYGDVVNQPSKRPKRKIRNYQDGNWYKTLKDLSEDQFLKEFRISKPTFYFISRLLGPYWTKNNSILDDHDVDERVAIGIWKLANGESSTKVSRNFGVLESCVGNILYDFYTAIESELKEYLKWPDMENKMRIKSEFEDEFGIPNIIGTVYTTHIEVCRHGGNVGFLNLRNKERPSKSVYTLPVQGVVDSKGKFIDVFCHVKVGGGKTDEEVLEISKINEKVGSDEVIVGGCTYPLERWLLVPYNYSVQEQSTKQRIFDVTIAEVRETTMNAFSQLVGRWSYLQKPINVELCKLPGIIRVCCILHNICTEREDILDPEFLHKVFDYPTPLSVREASPSLMEARDRIADNLFDHPGIDLLVNQ